MKKSRMRDNILKRILCVMLIVCMVSPSVVTYASPKEGPQEVGQGDNDSDEKDDSGSDEKDHLTGTDESTKDARTEVRTLRDEEVSVSVSDVYYMSGDSDDEMVSIPKDSESGNYLLTKDILAQSASYGVKLSLEMTADENGWDIINGDTYQMSLDGGSDDGLVEFVTGQGGSVITNDGIEIGTYAVDGQLLAVTFNDWFVNTTQNSITAEINVEFAVDGSKFNVGNDQNIQLNLGGNAVGILISDSNINFTNDDDTNTLPSNKIESASNNRGNISGEKNEILNGVIPAQSIWNVAGKKHTIKSKTAGSFKAQITAATYNRNNKRVGFTINDVNDNQFGLNSDYLKEIYEFASELDGYPDPFSATEEAQAAWWEESDNLGDLQSLIFSIDLGNASLWALPGGADNSGRQITENSQVVLKTNDDLEVADGIFTIADSGNLILTVTYRNNVVYIYNENVAAGLSFGLDLNTDKWNDTEEHNVEWDDEEGIKLTGDGGSDKPDSGSTGFEIEKTVQGGTNPGGDTTITDACFTYQIEVKKWKKIISELEGEVTSGITLAGSTLSDKIPSELDVQAVRVNSKDRFSENASNRCQYDPVTGQLSYVFTEEDDLRSEEDAILPAIVEIDVVLKQTNISDNSIIMKNEAAISDHENTPSKSDVQTTTLRKPTIFKEGSVDGLDTKRVSWKVSVDSYFSAEVDSYIVDRIDGSIQKFDEKSLAISKGKETVPLSSVKDLTSSTSTCPEYKVLKGEGGAGIIRNALSTYRNNDGTYQHNAYLLKTNVVGGKFDYILIIPYKEYDNEKRVITYDTILNDTNAPGEDEEIKNEVSLVWDYDGAGIGPGELDWRVDIYKDVELKGDKGFKTGSYEEKTQITTWTVRVNPYGENLKNVVVEDTFDNTKQIVESVELIPYARNSLTGKFEPNEINTLDKVNTNPEPLQSYTLNAKDSGNSSQEFLLTVPLGNLNDNVRYDVVIKTQVIDPAILSLQGTSELSNTAIIKSDNGTPSDVSTTINTPNTLIKKDVRGTYNYDENSITWEVTINPDKINKIPITEAKLIEILPFGSTLTKWSVRKGDTGEFAEPTGDGTKAEVGEDNNKIVISRSSPTKEKSGTGDANGKFTAGSGEFIQRTECFEFNKEITDSYTFRFTTKFTDELYKQSFLMSYDKVRMENNAILEGKYKGTSISEAKVMAETTINPQPVVKKGHAYDKPDESPAKITWTIDINRAKANIQGGIIKENFGKSKLLELEPNSIKIRELTVNSSGAVSDGPELLLSDIGKIFYNEAMDGFEIQLKNQQSLEKCIRIVFDTYIIDTPSDFNSLTNSITVSSEGKFSYSKNNVKSENKLSFNFDSWARASKSPMLRVMKYAARHESDPSDGKHLMLQGAVMNLDAYVFDEVSKKYVFDSSKSKQRITNSQGYANFVCLKEKVVYDLYEVEAPKGYTPSELHKYYMLVNEEYVESNVNVTLNKNIDEVEATATLIKKGNIGYLPADRDILYANDPTEDMDISFVKLNGRGDKVSGITFELKHDSSAIKTHSKTTGEDGKVTFSNIDPGKYTLTEIIPSEMKEFYSVQPIKLSVDVDGNGKPKVTVDSNPNNDKVKVDFAEGSTNNLIIKNEYKSGTIKLKKVETGTNKPLEGAVFAIYKGVGTNSYASTTDLRATSSANGIITFSDIVFNPYGYKIIEEKAPAGYIKNDEPIYISGDDMRRSAGEDSFELDLTTAKAISNDRVRADITFDKYLQIDETKIPLMNRVFILKYTGSDSYDMSKYGFEQDENRDWCRILKKHNGGEIDKPSYTFKEVPLGTYKLIEESLEGDSYTEFEVDIDLMEAYKNSLTGSSELPSGQPFVYKVNTDGAAEGEIMNTLLDTDIYLNKVDSITGELVDGAQFTLEGHPDNRDSVSFGPKEYSAGGGGLKIEKLPIGTYTLTETAAPINYIIGNAYTITVVSERIDNTNHAVAYIKEKKENDDITGLGTICSNPNEPYAIPNDAITGSLSLIKLGKGYTDSGADSEGTAGDTVVLKDGLPISGAAFKLLPVVEKGGKWVTVKETDVDGNVKDKIVSEGITKEEGSLTFEELPYCDYLLIEETPDGYYAMDPVLLKKKYFVIQESDEATATKTFQWNGKYKKVTVDGNGDYTETEAEEDFSSEPDDVNIITDIPVVLDASFTKILIDNVEGEEGNILTDAKFTVERLGSGGGASDEAPFENAYDLTKSFVSYVPCSEVEPDDSGVVTINNLICGIYKITETEWKEGSRPVDAKPIVVMYLKVARNDEGGFSVWRYKAIKDGELVDNSDDVINVDRLESDSAYMGVVANSPYNLGMVNFTKSGNGGSKPLVGAIFGLYRKDKETNEYSPVTMYPDGENVTTVTGDRGTGIFQYLTHGSYAIKELKAPEGHILDNTYYEFEISENNLTGLITNPGIGDNIITNKQNSYQIQKQDMSGKLLNGAVFTVTGRFANGTASTTKTYTVNGTSALIAGELVAGESYVIKETAAPAGYSIAAPITVYIDENGQLYDSAENKIADNKVIIKDEMIDMGLYKVSAENFSSAGTSAVTRLEGAEFTVSPVTGSVFADGSKSITINDQNYSTAFKGKLVAGNSYTVTETKAPYGYTVAAPFTFSVNANGGVSIASAARNYVKASTSGQLVIYVADEQGTGDVTLVKKDAGSSEELPGAGFKLYRKSTAGTYALVADKILYSGNTYKMTGTSAIDNGTANSPANGKLTVSGLPWGSYQFVEVEAPDGYVLDGTPYSFDITGSKANGMSVDLGTVKNQKTAVKVSKVDESGAALSGATLAILNSDGKEEERWVTDGTVHIISGLIPGATYKLHEVKAPAGYELADDITFTVPANGQYELSMTDIKKPTPTPTPTPGGTTGSVVVTKTVFYEGKPLAIHDLSFYAALYSDADLTNRVSEIMELAFTGSYSTTVTFDNLPLGTYYVAEVDEFGDVYDGSDIGMEVEVIDQQCVLTQTSPRGSAVIKNTMPELPDGFYIDPTGKLTVTKKVLNKDKTEATVKNTSFYVTLFSDEDYLLAVSDPMEIEIANGSSGTVIFDELALGTYYLAETDEDGFPVDAGSDDFAYTPVFSKDSFEIADENQSVEVTLTNTLKKGEVTPTATPKATVTTKPGTYSSSPAKSTLSTGTSSKAANAKTGDETPLFWYFVLLAAASAGIILAAGRKRKRMK